MISGGIMRPLDAAEPLAWRLRIRPRMSDSSNMDELITGIDLSERRRCTACGEKASFGFGPPGSPALDADAWYCGAHQAEGERLWAAAYPLTGGGSGQGGCLCVELTPSAGLIAYPRQGLR